LGIFITIFVTYHPVCNWAKYARHAEITEELVVT